MTPVQTAPPRPAPPCVRAPVSPEEARLLAMLAAGANFVQAAERFGMSKTSIQRRVRDLRWRTDTATVAHLVATALRNGWIR